MEPKNSRDGEDLFEVLTTKVQQGMSIRAAAAEVAVPKTTAHKWVVKARSGKPYRSQGAPEHPGKEEFFRLRNHGLTVPEAAAQVQASLSAAYRWDQQMRAAAGLPTWSRRRAGAYNKKMRAHQLLSGTDTNPRFLSVEEREMIYGLRGDGLSVRAIAAELGRSASTISREIRRNADSRGRYHRHRAHRVAAGRRARPKTPRLMADPRLGRWVQQKLHRRWSPAQISKRLVKDFPEDAEMRVSHETIYQALYFQARGGLKREVQAALRTGRARRKPHGTQRRPRTLGEDMILISDRPAEVQDRAVPGHWEGDLIIGSGSKSAIATLVERHTRFVMLCHLPSDHTAQTVATALTQRMKSLPQHLRGSLTWDQGSEMAAHHQISVAADLPIYFCDPASPWQRGSNENTNGLLRQYFPKGTDLSVHGPEDLEYVADELNGRPRETLEWHTPAEKMRDLLLAG